MKKTIQKFKMKYLLKKPFLSNLMNCLILFLTIRKNFLELLKIIYHIYSIFLDYVSVIIVIVGFVAVNTQFRQNHLNYHNFKMDF